MEAHLLATIISRGLRSEQSGLTSQSISELWGRGARTAPFPRRGLVKLPSFAGGLEFTILGESFVKHLDRAFGVSLPKEKRLNWIPPGS